MRRLLGGVVGGGRGAAAARPLHRLGARGVAELQRAVRRSAPSRSTRSATAASTRGTTSPRCCSTRTRRARGTRTCTTCSCRPTRRCCRTRPAPRAPGTSSSIRRSGSGWRCATTSRRRSSRTLRARPTATPTSSTAPTRPAPDYIGKHPGTAFLEVQFYPPGWAPWPPGVSCDATKWCAAMAIFSLNQDQNTGVSEQRRLPEHGRRRAGELRLHHEERRAARTARRRSTRRTGLVHAERRRPTCS